MKDSDVDGLRTRAREISSDVISRGSVLSYNEMQQLGVFWGHARCQRNRDPECIGDLMVARNLLEI